MRKLLKYEDVIKIVGRFVAEMKDCREFIGRYEARVVGVAGSEQQKKAIDALTLLKEKMEQHLKVYSGDLIYQIDGQLEKPVDGMDFLKQEDLIIDDVINSFIGILFDLTQDTHRDKRLAEEFNNVYEKILLLSEKLKQIENADEELDVLDEQKRLLQRLKIVDIESARKENHRTVYLQSVRYTFSLVEQSALFSALIKRVISEVKKKIEGGFLSQASMSAESENSKSRLMEMCLLANFNMALKVVEFLGSIQSGQLAAHLKNFNEKVNLWDDANKQDTCVIGELYVKVLSCFAKDGSSFIRNQAEEATGSERASKSSSRLSQAQESGIQVADTMNTIRISIESLNLSELQEAFKNMKETPIAEEQVVEPRRVIGHTRSHRFHSVAASSSSSEHSSSVAASSTSATSSANHAESSAPSLPDGIDPVTKKPASSNKKGPFRRRISTLFGDAKLGKAGPSKAESSVKQAGKSKPDTKPSN